MTIVASLGKIVAKSKKPFKKIKIKKFFKSIMWFSLGAVLGFFFFISFVFIIYQKTHNDKVYEGVVINGIDFGGKTKQEVKNYFENKNSSLKNTQLTISSPQAKVHFSAKEVKFGYDADLIANQAVSLGRSSDIISNMSLIYQAYTQNIILPPAYKFSDKSFDQLTKELIQRTTIEPIDPLFNFENNRVVTFRQGKDGQKVDSAALKQNIQNLLKETLEDEQRQNITLAVPIITIKSAITEDKANSLGIKEPIGTGTSSFRGSIENRAFNINLAASRLNGVLIKPNETFSFDQQVGDISAFSGYRQAYVIQNGKTVLGDGGGVCQVSTTLFRAALRAGLPIIERNPHAYRVGYYEQDSGPGVDAAIYSPTVDLKFKNDTGHHILIQTYADLNSQQLTFTFFGTKDSRIVEVSTPIVLSESPAPEPLYQDDPTLPKGTVKQVDFSAPGAQVFFTRTVSKDGKVLLSDRFNSNYRPWQAVYMRGTKE